MTKIDLMYPTDEEIQFKVAEELGYTPYIIEWKNHNLHPYFGADIPNMKEDVHKHVLSKIYYPDEDLSLYGDRLPDWPTDLNIARTLPIRFKNQYKNDYSKFANCLTKITGGSLRVIFHTSQQWCLGWLLYKSWERKYCNHCEGKGKVPSDMPNSILPDRRVSLCPACCGEARRWTRPAKPPRQRRRKRKVK